MWSTVCGLSRFAVVRRGVHNFTASTKQFLCRAGVCSFSGSVSSCKYCKVRVISTFSCFAHQTLCSFHSGFCFAVGLLVPRAACSVLEAPFLGKFCKLVRCKLSTIVTNDNVRDSVSGKVALEFPDASTGFGVTKSVNFPKVGTVVDQNKVVFSSKTKRSAPIFS